MIPNNLIFKMIYLLLSCLCILQIYCIYASGYGKTMIFQYRRKIIDDEEVGNFNANFIHPEEEEEEEDEDERGKLLEEGGEDADGVLGHPFPNCYSSKRENCSPIDFPIYDDVLGSYRERLLQPVIGEKYVLPNFSTIPRKRGKIGYCGFGHLLFNRETKVWRCKCMMPQFFGGATCDEIGSELVKNHNCLQVAYEDDPSNTDVSTFNPIIEGICTQCVSPETQSPVITGVIPQCQDIRPEKKKLEIDYNNPCKYDALKPGEYFSENNRYVPGYGCVCDYHNGFVEATLPTKPRQKSEQKSDAVEVSNACIKVGRDDPSSYHRTDVAYYSLFNNFHPIQIHSFKKLEYPFNIIFPKAKELLVKQLLFKKSDTNDWLNRHIKPSRKQPIHRLNYPYAKWPVVNKKSLYNYYSHRDTTYPISAFKLATGGGFETQHWYELSNSRYIQNAVLGHPIIYTHEKGNPWTGKVAINPLGAIHRKYYGATVHTKPGEVVKLDTREFEDNSGIIIPPNYQSEMMDENRIIYLPYLYVSYNIE